MNQVQFEESEVAHADRLGVSPGFVHSRRALLVEQLGGPVPAEREVQHLPERVRTASAATLMAALDVQVVRSEGPSSKRSIVLGPVAPGEAA